MIFGSCERNEVIAEVILPPPLPIPARAHPTGSFCVGSIEIPLSPSLKGNKTLSWLAGGQTAGDPGGS